MRRLLLTLAGLLAVLSPSAQAQEDLVQGELFVRRVGDGVRALIRIQVEEDWHIYHTDVGPSDAPGLPTTLEPRGENVEWGTPVLPQPYKHEAAGSWSWSHHGTVLIRIEGRVAGGEPGDIGVLVEGMVCEDDGVCILFELDLEDGGEGEDELFADWEARTGASGPTANPDRPAAIGGLGLRPAFLGGPGAEDGEEELELEELQAALYVRQDGERIEAALVLKIAAGWHYYHHELGDPKAIAQAARIELRGEGVEWGALEWPAPKREEYDDFWVWAHSGEVVLRASGRATGEPRGIAARVEGQICERLCLEVAQTVPASGRGEDRYFNERPVPASTTPARGSDQPSAGSSVGAGTATSTGSSGGGGGSLFAFILAAIAGGIFALLMPCTYPMIPITISFFTKQAEARGGKVLSLSLAYGAGIVLIFIAIGVAVGPLILAFATNPVTNLVIGILFVLFAFVLFGVWTLQPPRFLMSAAGKASRKGGYAGVFLMGMTLVVTSFTCTAPFVGSLLSIGATAGDGLGRIAIGMAFFGLTMAVPFVFLSLVPGKLQSIPQSGEWMHVLKVTLGFVELAAALKFFSNADLVWGWGLLSREVFLMLWAGIFAVAAFFLFGKIQLAGERVEEIGPGRMVAGLGSLLLSLYCLHGYNGHELDTVMTAIAPNYSTRIEGGGHGGEGAQSAASAAQTGHTIVTDDFARARTMAAERNAPLFINFTGFT